MTSKLSTLLAIALAAEVFSFAPVTAAPLRVSPALQEQAPLVTDVNHRRRHWGRRGDVAGAIIGGLAAGAIIGALTRPRYYDDYYYERRYYRPRVDYSPRGGIDAHQRWCLNRWRSYDVYSDTYQPYHGPRRYCNSPYN
ncbi:MAG: BA14K family protein [Rhizobiaceae bacterium]